MHDVTGNPHFHLFELQAVLIHFCLSLFIPSPVDELEFMKPVCVFLGAVHSPIESLSDSWTRLKNSRDWLFNSTCSFEESDFDFTKSIGIHTLIENIISFVSGDVGSSPGFKEPEESMSTSPQAYIIAMEQQQQRAEVCYNYFLSF